MDQIIDDLDRETVPHWTILQVEGKLTFSTQGESKE